jgi:protocatechuate 3,4-dioxygenase beta subunit
MNFVMTYHKTQDFTVTSSGETFSLSGTVTQSGSPVIGAQLRYTINGGAEQTVFTTESGYYIFAPTGSTVTINGITGYDTVPSLPMQFVMTSDRVQNFTVTPDGKTTFTLSGTVTHNGNAVVGATMRYMVNGGPEQTVLTTASGYSITALSGSTIRILGIVGYDAVPSLPMNFLMTYHKTQDFTVTPDGRTTFTLSGTVTYNGNAVIGATMSYTIGATTYTLSTTASGYSIPALVGSTVTINGIAGYDAVPSLPMQFVMTSDKVQNFTVTPDGKTSFTLSGTVTQNGNAVVGATVRYTINGGAEQTVLTTSSGYSISALVGSTVTINGIVGYTTVPPLPLSFVMTSDKVQNFTVSPSGERFTLSGTVRDASGNAVVGATMRYTIGTISYTLSTTASGYSISAPVGSTVTITEIVGYNVVPSLPMAFAMTSDKVQNFTVTPDGKTMFTLSGTVKDASGNPVIGATMNYTIGVTTFTLSTDANGAYSISALVGSTVTINRIVGYNTVPSLPMSFAMTSDKVQDFTATPDGVTTFTLSGTVKTISGTPIEVTMRYTINGTPYTLNTDVNGAYSISALVGSTITITEIVGYNVTPFLPLPFVMTSDKVQNFTVTPKEAGTVILCGTVRDTSGNYVVGVTMRYTVNGTPYTLNTDSVGFYSITVPIGSTIRILEFVGYTASPSTPRDFVMTLDRTQNFTLTPDGKTMFTVSGTVKDASGSPIIGAAMNYTVNGGAVLSVLTTANGYSISAPSGSTVRITEIVGYYASPSLPMSFIMTSSKTQNFTVTPDGKTMFTLSGMVMTSSGAVVIGAEIRYTINGGAAQSVLTTVSGYSISAPSDSIVRITSIVNCTTEPTLPIEFRMTNNVKQGFIVTSSSIYTVDSTVNEKGWGELQYYDGTEWLLLPSSLAFYGKYTVMFRAVAYTGYGFSYWSGVLNGNDSGMTTPMSLIIDSDKRIGGVFYDAAPGKNYTLTVDQSMVNGIIQWSVDGTIPFKLSSVTFPVGTVVNLEAIGNLPWKLSYWTGALGGNTNPANITMNGNQTVGAVFYHPSDPYFMLKLDGPVENGKIMWFVGSGVPAELTTAGVILPAGTDVDFKAVADEGYTFSHWTDAVTGSDGIYAKAYFVSGELGINAVFAKVNDSSFGIIIWVAILLGAILALSFLFALKRRKQQGA